MVKKNSFVDLPSPKFFNGFLFNRIPYVDIPMSNECVYTRSVNSVINLAQFTS